MKAKIVVMAMLIMSIIVFAGCGQAAQENHLSNTFPMPTSTPPITTVDLSTPSPAPAPATDYLFRPLPVPTPLPMELYEYNLDEEQHTFTLTQCITPKEGMPPLLIHISGSLDEKNYWLKGNRLSIIDKGTGKPIQTFLAEEEPFITTTFWASSLEYYKKYEGRGDDLYECFLDIVVDDFNFDGWQDFRLIYDIGGKNYFYRYWLWNPDYYTFEYSTELEELYLSNPVFLGREKIIYSHFQDSASNFTDEVFCYINGVPTLIEQREVFYVRERDAMVDIIYKRVDGEMILVQWIEAPHDEYFS